MKIAILEGYEMPTLEGVKRKRRSSGRASSAQTNHRQKFKACARKCKGGSGYRSCMRGCLRKKKGH